LHISCIVRHVGINYDFDWNSSGMAVSRNSNNVHVHTTFFMPHTDVFL